MAMEIDFRSGVRARWRVPERPFVGQRPPDELYVEPRRGSGARAQLRKALNKGTHIRRRYASGPSTNTRYKVDRAEGMGFVLIPVRDGRGPSAL